MVTLGGRSQRPGTFDSLAFAGRVHRLPQITALLRIEPEVRTIAEYPGKNEGRRGSHFAPVVAQFIDVLALHAHGFGQGTLGERQGFHELFGQNFADARRLTLGHQHGLASPIAVVVQIEVRRFTPTAIPLEDEPPLLADADRMEFRQLAA